MRNEDYGCRGSQIGGIGKNCKRMFKLRGFGTKNSMAFGIAWSLVLILFLLCSVCISSDIKTFQELIQEPVNYADIALSNNAHQNIKAKKVEISYGVDGFYRIDGRKVHLVPSLEKIAFRSQSGKSVSIMSSLNEIGQPEGAFVVDREIPEFGITVLRTSGVESVNEINSSISRFNELPGVESAVPVYINAESGLEQIPTEQFIAKIAEGTSPEKLNALNQANGVTFIRSIKGTKDQFILEIPGCTPEQLLATCETYYQDAAIEWAEPDFVGQIDNLGYTPNDPLFDEQWYLKIMSVPQAWDVTTGSDQIIIAVLDVGFDLQHEDLKDSLPSNSGEIADNGIDDDGNGYIDDVNGWDFYNDDNDPTPDTDEDNHGTSVAGLAVAKGDNNLGIAGCAFNCKLMPVVVCKNDNFVQSQMIEGIYYAAGFTSDRENWRGADVISMSFGITESSGINEAITAAANQGRDGKGCPIFCSSGNAASFYYKIQLPSIPGAWPDKWSWVISYRKNSTFSGGDDTAWISEFVNADGAVTRFDTLSAPPGWTLRPFSGWDMGWYIEDDPAHAYGTSRYQLRNEDIGDAQEAFVRAPEFTTTNDIIPGISFRLWRSCEGDDTLYFYVYNHSDRVLYGPMFYAMGMVYEVKPAVRYPARHPDTIAVGASTDLDYRSDYSCYGPELDFVAPSGGGINAIVSTDRTGMEGYESGKYTTSFSGTSASAPLAAGVAGLLLSNDPNMTASEVRNAMRDGCDKIGRVEYQNGTNIYYGYGRLNAVNALGQISGETAED